MSTLAVPTPSQVLPMPLMQMALSGMRARTKSEIVYPDSDGKPMADNTRQFELIVTIHGGLAFLFEERPDVFVAGDLLWYPVEGDNKLRVAPDIMVAFGRPPGHRGSYRQWCENNVAPQVVFEIVSPGNRLEEMDKKFIFYEKYGVEEYYIHDPDRGTLKGWLRKGQHLAKIKEMNGWISPKLDIRFQLEALELILYRSDGKRFESFVKVHQRLEIERQRAEAALQRVELERQHTEEERQRAEVAILRAEAAILRAEAADQRAEAADQRAVVADQRTEVERQRAEAANQRAEFERKRNNRIVAQLQALGINPDLYNFDI